jgi:hypothetical protein
MWRIVLGRSCAVFFGIGLCLGLLGIQSDAQVSGYNPNLKASDYKPACMNLKNIPTESKPDKPDVSAQDLVDLEIDNGEMNGDISKTVDMNNGSVEPEQSQPEQTQPPADINQNGDLNQLLDCTELETVPDTSQTGLNKQLTTDVEKQQDTDVQRNTDTIKKLNKEQTTSKSQDDSTTITPPQTDTNPNTCEMRIGDGFTKADADQLIADMQEAEQSANEYGLTYSWPDVIELNDDGKGIRTGTDPETGITTMTFDSVNQDGAYEKVFQEALKNESENLGYQMTETLGRTLNDFIMGGNTENDSGGNHQYNPALQHLTGDDIYQAYTDYQNGDISKTELENMKNDVMNNNHAMSESLNAVLDGMDDADAKQLAKDLIANLDSLNNGTGQDLLNLVLNLAGDQYTPLIIDSLKDHNITN